MSKYYPLRVFLEAQRTEAVPMTFAQIERVLGFALPKSKAYPAWWSNNPTNNVMTSEWRKAGFKTEQVDIEGQKLVFRRDRPAKNGPAEAAITMKNAGGKHPLLGAMKGMMTIAPGVDLTAPADPDWGEVAWGEADEKRAG